MTTGLIFIVFSSLLVIFILGKAGYFRFIWSRGSLVILARVLYVEDTAYRGEGVFVDSLRLGLVILRGWVTLLMFYSRYKILRFKELAEYFLFIVYFLMFILVLTFLVDDYLIFYFLFEVSLIPTLIIIMG